LSIHRVFIVDIVSRKLSEWRSPRRATAEKGMQMTDPRPHPDANRDTGPAPGPSAHPGPGPGREPGSETGPGAGSAAGTPRWVKVFGSIGLVLALLLAIMLLTGHGPGRHLSSGEAGGLAPLSSVMERGAPGGYAPPEGGRR
jgi:hypothetical protein